MGLEVEWDSKVPPGEGLVVPDLTHVLFPWRAEVCMRKWVSELCVVSSVPWNAKGRLG